MLELIFIVVTVGNVVMIITYNGITDVKTYGSEVNFSKSNTTAAAAEVYRY